MRMKKDYRIFFPIMLIVLVLTACQMPLENSASGELTGSADYILPPDTVEDAPRVFSGNFTYETLLPVKLDLSFELYDPDQAEGREALSFDDSEEGAAPKIYVTVKDQEGNLLYAGAVAADKTLERTLYLPAAPKNIELFLEAEGFETRRVTVNNMARFSVIRRTLSMMRESSGNLSLNLSNKGLGPMTDSDGDGVPDKYDLYPDDPEAAFGMNVPAAESITIAFEDLFGHKNAGDADYNDFIASYTINEVMNAEGMITRIEVQAEAREKLAGYNHSFGIRIDSYSGQANLTGSFTNRGGNSARLAGRPKAPVEIVLFERTASAVGKSAWFVLDFDTPQDPAAISSPPYNPYLYVHDTRHDIHLIDAEPLKKSINPYDRFIDEDGFPWALLIPADWEYPAEGQRIEELYPYFTDWRESGGMEYEDWYERDGDEPPEENLPPYPVISADQAVDPSVRELAVNLAVGESYQLAIAVDEDGLKDPNNDPVIFVSDMSVAMKDYFSLDELSGSLTLTKRLGGTFTIRFWSAELETSDLFTTEDDPLTLIITTGGS